jgi:acyl-CoA reductase-like NAD-dependent aldehyde dehydrogenase
MADSTLKVFAPYDGHLIKELPMTSMEEAEEILEQADALFQDRSKWLPKFERIKILKAFGKILSENVHELARQAAKEGGKPLADSIIEVNRAINGVEVAVQEIGQMRGTEIPMGLNAASTNHMAYTLLEPVGPVAAVSAFNHPVNLIIHQVVPAVATGCPVIIKPAAATPLSCFLVVEMLYEAGLPKEWCRAIVCDRDVTNMIVSDSRIRFVTFIGSAKVGWKLRSSLAPGASCALEHGGAAPVIVEPDSDIDAILPGLVKGGYYHAGQVCVSVQRMYVHKDIMSEVKEKMVEMVKRLKVGDPLEETTEVGPLIKPGEVDRVDTWVKEAVSDGAELLCGGNKISSTCYEPTLLFNPSKSSKCTTEEIFGPVVCLYEYENYLDAVERANELPFNFQAAVYTKSIEVALDCVNRLKAKAVMVNQHTAFRVDWMPFGGAEISGLGVGGIGYSMRDMCHEKLMVIKSDAI